MANRLIWSPEAVDDLESIRQYICEESEDAAVRVITEIFHVIESIREFPHAGRAVPELHGDEFRERFVFNYRIIYRPSSQAIKLLGVIHGRRDFYRLLDRFESE